ncbi:MAG: hypothetical protein K2M76_03965 [Muribaculaceae bacterium]|nr:hypothetical protein [Muribaculaceae bacterium]
METAYTTQVFRTGAHHYMRAVSELWLGRWWWTFVVPVGACFALAAAVNVAFTFVGFMLLFLVAPMILMALYMGHALTDEARMAILPHCVSVDAGGITVDFPVADDDTERREASRRFTPDDIAGVERRSRDVVVMLKGRSYRFMLIPYDVMGDASMQHAFVSRLEALLPKSIEKPQTLV